MALQYSQFTWGFAVATGSNDTLDFVRNGSTYSATLNAGDYTAGGLAAEVQRAMREAAGAVTDITATFSYSTLKFTIAIASPGNLTLKFASPTTTCAGLLGFNTTDRNTDGSNDGDSYDSDSAAGGTYSVAKVWTLAEPHDYTSPISAQTDGSPAKLTRRQVKSYQAISHGGAVDSVYYSTVKLVEVGFRALTSSEQTNMEDFLDWVVQLRPFAWQPDASSPNVLRLVADASTVQKINADFEWATRQETTYGRLRFLEDVSR